MSYTTPETRAAPVEEVLAALSDTKRVILTTHSNADADGAGSEVALASWLRGTGKQAWIINPTPFPESLAFLLAEGIPALDPSDPEARAVAQEADFAVVLDTGEVSRIGGVARLIHHLPKAVVDHHPPGPDAFDAVSLRDPTASAAGELVFDLVTAGGGPWSATTLLGIYVAILSDTGSFKFGNATPNAFRIAAELVERGVDPEGVHRRLYGNEPLRKHLLLRAALGELEVDPAGTIAWMTVPTDAYRSLECKPDDIEGLVDYPRGIEGVEVGLLFRETQGGGTKVSFRSNGSVDVNALARHFGGGGHVKASGALVNGPLADVRRRVLAFVRQAVNEEGGNG